MISTSVEGCVHAHAYRHTYDHTHLVHIFTYTHVGSHICTHTHRQARMRPGLRVCTHAYRHSTHSLNSPEGGARLMGWFPVWPVKGASVSGTAALPAGCLIGSGHAL